MELIALLIVILTSNYIVFRWTRDTSFDHGFNCGLNHAGCITEIVCKEVLEMSQVEMLDAHIKANEIFKRRNN